MLHGNLLHNSVVFVQGEINVRGHAYDKKWLLENFKVGEKMEIV